jgi:hypothetical protein
MYAGGVEVSFHTIKESKWLLLLHLSSERWKYIENKIADFGDSVVEGTRISKINEDASGLVGLNTKI